MIPWLRLGLRMSTGSGRAGLTRMALMASGAAIGTVLLLAALAVPGVISAQGQREQGRTPVFDSSRTDGLRMVEVEDSIGSRRLARIAVAGQPDPGLMPPGLTRLPQPGELIVSPALAALIENDDRASGRFPQQVVGTISAAGLVAPDELRAYLGVDPEELAGQPAVIGFRASHTFGPDPDPPAAWEGVLTTERVMAFAFAVFLLVPMGVFLATCARLSAATRDRRLAAIRLLGASRRQAQLVNAVENGMVASGGVTIGILAFVALRPISADWRIGRFHWYVADLAPPPVMLVGAALALIGFSVLVGAVASAPAITDPLAARRDAPARLPRTVRLAVPAVGLLLLCASLLTGFAFDVRSLLLGGGVLLSAVGLPVAIPVVASRLGRWLADQRVPVWLRLAGRRLEHQPSTAPRLVAAIVVAVFVSGVGLAAAAGYGTWSRPGPHNGAAVLTYTLPAAPPDLITELRSAPFGSATSATLISRGQLDGQPGQVLIGDCADLKGMFTGADTCHDGRVYQLHVQDEQPTPPARVSSVLTELHGHLVPVPRPDGILTLKPRSALYRTAPVFVTRQSVPAPSQLPDPDAVTVTLPTDEEQTEAFYQFMAVHAPAVAAQGYTPVERGFDPAAALTMVSVGLAVAMVLAGAGFTVAAIDRLVERRRGNAYLAVIGAPTRTVAAAELAFIGIPLLTGVTAAFLTVLVAIGAWSALLGVPAGEMAVKALPSAWGTGGVLLIALMVVPMAMRQRITAEQLRRA